MSDERPMIENSDRGITLAKPLAWSIFIAIIGGGIWVGQQTGSVQSELVTVAGALSEIKAAQSVREERSQRDREALDVRLRAVENSRVQDAAEINGLRRDLTDFRAELKEATSLFRNAVEGRKP
jgi:hypothetical protein